MNKEEFYSMVEPKDDWSFSDIPRSETRELTHSYHLYPAKFIPQLARAFINEYTDEGGFIWDSFCGSGTLNLEALRTNRNSLQFSYHELKRHHLIQKNLRHMLKNSFKI
jgi:DNA modification methylase